MILTKNIFNEHFWLPFFRISISLLCLLEIMSYWNDFNLFYSENGIIKSDIISATTDSISYTLTDIYSFVNNKLSINIKFNDFINIVRVIYCIALTLVTVGLFTKLNTLLCIFLQLLISKSFPEIQYGFD